MLATLLNGGGASLTALQILQSKGAAFCLHDFVGRLDLTFQEAIGPTPANASGQPVGLALSDDQIGDLSLTTAIAAQAEKASNPGGPYIATTGWVAGFSVVNGTLTVSGGLLVLTRGSSDGAGPRFVLPMTGMTVGKTYALAAGALGGTSASQSVSVSASSAGTGAIASTLVAATIYFVATATTMYLVFGNNGAVGTTATLASASVKLVPGNHATQAVSNSFRPLRQTDGSVKADKLDDNLLSVLTSTTSMFFASSMLASTVPGAVATIIGGPIGTARGYLARDASGKLCGGVGADGTGTIVGGSDISGLKGVAMLNVDAVAGQVDLEWWPGGGNLQSLYSQPINGAIGVGTALRLFATNAGGVAANFGGDSHYVDAAIQTALTAAERRDLAADLLRRIPA